MLISSEVMRAMGPHKPNCEAPEALKPKGDKQQCLEAHGVGRSEGCNAARPCWPKAHNQKDHERCSVGRSLRLPSRRSVRSQRLISNETRRDVKSVEGEAVKQLSCVGRNPISSNATRVIGLAEA